MIKLGDLCNVITFGTVGKIRDTKGNIICNGIISTDEGIMIPEEFYGRKVNTVYMENNILCITID